MLPAFALTALLHACAPSVTPDTMGAIIAVESHGDPYAIHDNTTKRSYFPHSRAEAQTILTAARQDNVDVGISQVNVGWFATFGVTAREMLEPCRNVQVGSVILTRAYRVATASFPQPRAALWHAISMYNTGSLYAGAAYVQQVVDEATAEPAVPSIALLTPGALSEVTKPAIAVRRHTTLRRAPTAAAQVRVYHVPDHNGRVMAAGLSAIHAL